MKKLIPILLFIAAICSSCENTTYCHEFDDGWNWHIQKITQDTTIEIHVLCGHEI